MIHNEVLCIIEVVHQGNQLCPGEFVGTIDCLILSINPVHTVLEDNDAIASHYFHISISPTIPATHQQEEDL